MRERTIPAARGQLAMHGSLLFTAPHTGTFWCQIRAHTDAGHDFTATS